MKQLHLKGAILVGFGLLWGCTTSTRETIRAERFQLTDASGVVRAEMSIDDDGSAGFFLIDKEGRRRGALIHDDSQTALYLMDEDGTIRVGAAQFAHGGGGFALHGEQSNGATVMYMKDGAGRVSLYAPDGTETHRFPIREPATRMEEEK